MAETVDKTSDVVISAVGLTKEFRVPFKIFSIPSLAFIICRLFDDGPSDQYEVIAHCCFDLHFSNN